MASVTASRSVVKLPEQLEAVLDIRKRTYLEVPGWLEATLARIPFFQHSGLPSASQPRCSDNKHAASSSSSQSHIIPSFRCGFTSQQNPSRGSGQSAKPTHSRLTHEHTGNRFMSLANSHAPEGWRNTDNSSSKSTQEHDDDGFETWTSGGRRSGGKRGNNKHSRPEFRPATNRVVPTADSPVSESNSKHESASVAWKSSRYQSVETKLTTESIDDRIMGKIRAKINKIGESTYGATKAFMQQILDSGETGFLEEFMQWVFQKSAMEPAFCGIYARLLHDLADEFGHLRTEMHSRFRNYTSIFAEAKNAPDVGTKDYLAFVEAQSQKKFRRGYSQFVAELAKLGEIPSEDFRILVEQIVKSIGISAETEENKTLCEELVDCLVTMCTACGRSILSKTSWMNDCIRQLDVVIRAARTDLPGLSNKARFGLMGLHDAHKSSWRS